MGFRRGIGGHIVVPGSSSPRSGGGSCGVAGRDPVRVDHELERAGIGAVPSDPLDVVGVGPIRVGPRQRQLDEPSVQSGSPSTTEVPSGPVTDTRTSDSTSPANSTVTRSGAVFTTSPTAGQLAMALVCEFGGHRRPDPRPPSRPCYVALVCRQRRGTGSGTRKTVRPPTRSMSMSPE